MGAPVVVIGAGLAGLTCATRLAEQGLAVLVLATGQGATHLAPPLLDVLGYVPDRVEHPFAAVDELAAAMPAHPYARLGAATVRTALDWFTTTVGGFVGPGDRNLLLPTAVGGARPTAAAPATMAGGDLGRPRRVGLVELSALRDFHAGLAADVLARGGLVQEAAALRVATPTGGADTSPMRYAQLFTETEFIEAVVAELRPQLSGLDAVGFPAVLGFDTAERVWARLQDSLGVEVFEIALPPPSIPGIRFYRRLVARLRAAGGRVEIGSPVRGARTDQHKVIGVRVATAGRDREVAGSAYVLATGGLRAGGLLAGEDGRVREPILDLPVPQPPQPTGDLPVPQPPQPTGDLATSPVEPRLLAGLAVDDVGRPVDADGRVCFDNLYAVGATLGVAASWRELSGHGIALASGYQVAGSILSRSQQ